MKTEEGQQDSGVRSRGPVDLVIAGVKLIPATIYEVSVSGASLEAAVSVEPGTTVRLVGSGASADAVVASCDRQGGAYRIVVVLKALDGS